VRRYVARQFIAMFGERIAGVRQQRLFETQFQFREWQGQFRYHVAAPEIQHHRRTWGVVRERREVQRESQAERQP
jgi:hypothetical protein